MKDSDPLSKSDMNPMDDGDFFNIFNLDDEDLNDFLGTGNIIIINIKIFYLQHEKK